MTTLRHDMTRSKLYHILFIFLPLLLLPNIATAQQTRSETDGRSREELVKLRKEFFAQELELTAEEATYLDRTLREADKSAYLCGASYASNTKLRRAAPYLRRKQPSASSASSNLSLS